MLSLYDINWAELTQIERWCFLSIFLVLFIIGTIDYLYKKYKEKQEMTKFEFINFLL